ncbi:hypothetical protein CEB3_c50400 [Peptococcaceae bacterium CEB3]|nr:hypothetical protein CEB3_c50400 [Peptococcaceae bacterium CEB3]
MDFIPTDRALLVLNEPGFARLHAVHGVQQMIFVPLYSLLSLRSFASCGTFAKFGTIVWYYYIQSTPLCQDDLSIKCRSKPCSCKKSALVASQSRVTVVPEALTAACAMPETGADHGRPAASHAKLKQGNAQSVQTRRVIHFEAFHPCSARMKGIL